MEEAEGEFAVVAWGAHGDADGAVVTGIGGAVFELDFERLFEGDGFSELGAAFAGDAGDLYLRGGGAAAGVGWIGDSCGWLWHGLSSVDTRF